MKFRLGSHTSAYDSELRAARTMRRWLPLVVAWLAFFIAVATLRASKQATVVAWVAVAIAATTWVLVEDRLR